MGRRTEESGLTRGTDLLVLMGVVAVVQVLLTYRAIFGEGEIVVDNLFWPYLGLAVGIGATNDLLPNLTYRLAVCLVGVALAVVGFAVSPEPAKLLLASVLGVAAVYYALETFVDGTRTTFAHP